MEEIIKKRILIILAVFVGMAIVFTYLNIQVDDERYYGFYEYEGYPDEANLDDGVVTVDETIGLPAGTVMAEIPAMHVDAGRYLLDVDHQNDEDFNAVVYDGDTVIESIALPASETNTRAELNLSDNLYNMHIAYMYNGTGSVTVKRSILYADGLFYTDTVFFAVLIILAAALISYLMIKKCILLMKGKELLFWVTLILFMICVNYPYYRPMWHMSPDGAFHLARIEGIYNEIRHGQFPVVMFHDALSGRGTIAALYPQLFLYIPALFRLLRVSLDGAVRVFFILLNLATCGTAYYAAKRLTGNRYMSLVTMMVYCLLPYRILTLLDRSAYGESQAFVFVPLVTAGLYDVIIGDRRRWPVLALGVSGVLQSHVISTMNVIAVCVIIGVIYTVRIVREHRYIQILYAVATAVLMNLWYIIPFIRYLRSDVSINEQMMTQDFSDEAYYVSRLIQFFPKQGLHIYAMGLGVILLTLAAAYLFMTSAKRNSVENFALILSLIGVVYVVMELKLFPWLALQKIQSIDYLTKMVKFPARLSVISQPMLLYGSASMIAMNRFRIPRVRLLLLAALCLTVMQGYIISDTFLGNLDEFIVPNEMRFEPDVANQFSYDYVPSGYWEEDFPSEAESPGARVTGYYHHAGHTVFEYTSDTETFVDVPVLYYDGYRATTPDGVRLGISKEDDASTRIELPATDTVLKVDMVFDYGNGPLWGGLFAVSIFGCIALCIYILRSCKE